MNNLEIKNLSKKYVGFSLDNVSFNIPAGKVLGLVGENGAGKSTTIKAILDMVKKDSGEIIILGKNNQDNLKLTKNDIGVVFDDIGISKDFNCIQVNKIMKNIFKNWNEETFFGYIDRFKLTRKKKIKEFSRGMRMKLGISIALSHDAKLLLLDEATSGLDPLVRDEILDMFLEFVSDGQRAILISSHIVSDLEKICDSIVFIHAGKVILFEDVDVIQNDYKFILCDERIFSKINKEAVIGSKNGKWGIEAIVRTDAIPEDVNVRPVDIEQLFLFMAREEDMKL